MNTIISRKYLILFLVAFSFFFNYSFCAVCCKSFTNYGYLSCQYQVSEQPRVTIDKNSNAVLIWRLFDGDSFRIQSSQYDFASNRWTSLNCITSCFSKLSLSVNDEGAWEQQLAGDTTGNGLAIWQLDLGAKSIIQSSRYDAVSKSWDNIASVQTLSDNTKNAFAPEIALAMDDNSDGFAVWEREGIIQATRYLSGTWLATVDISGSNTTSETPAVAVSQNGDATAVWTIFDDGFFRVQASQFTSGSWTSINQIPFLSDTDGNAYEPRVAMDANGNALAVWYRYNNSGNAIVQSAYKMVGTITWDVAENLSDPGQDAFFPKVAMNTNGDAIVIWQRFDGNNWRVQARQQPASTGMWSVVTNLSPEGFDAFDSNIAIDVEGNAVAIWTQKDVVANKRINTACYNAKKMKWSSTDVISIAGTDSQFADIAMNAAGNAMISWQQFDGRNWRIVAGLCQTAVPLPPEKVTGEQTTTRYPRCCDVINMICWQSPGGNVVSYNVYVWESKDGSCKCLLSTIPATQVNLCYCHHHQKCRQTTTYEIRSVNAAGVESDPVVIVVP